MASAMKQTKTKVTNDVETVEAIETVETPVTKVKETVIDKPIKKEYKPETPVKCVSITAGELGMIGIKSGINYTWAGRGDDTDIEYQDLVSAIRARKSHVFKPRFIIMDKDFLKEFPEVEKLYGSMYSIKDLKSVLELPPAKMKSTILSLPQGAQESIKNIASTEIAAGRLDSVQRIKTLDEIYNTKFMLMTELFSA